MLKTTILLLLALSSTYSFAQVNTDSSHYRYFLGGGIGYSSQTDKVEDTNDVNVEFKNWEISPSMGIRISRNVEIGLSINFERYLGNQESSSNTLGGSLFGRYFFYSKSKFSLNLSGSAAFANYNNILDNRPIQELIETDINQFILRFGIEAEYKFTPKLRVRSSLFRLSNNWYETKSSNSINTHGNIFRTETIFIINSIVVEFLF